MYLVISSSLNPGSRSRILARRMHQLLSELVTEVDWIDLQQWQLPLCDGAGCFHDPQVRRLAELIEQANGIIVAVPIYNYDVGAAAKNLVELTGKAWTQKVVGLVCAAGGQISYMSVMGLGNSLMLDFRSLILPNFVFATGEAFDDNDSIVDDTVDQRLTRLADTLVRVTTALHGESAEGGP